MRPVLKSEDIGLEIPVEFFLEDDGEGKLYLKARTPNKFGTTTTWYVGVIQKDGLFLAENIAEDTGIPLDKDGRIKIVTKEMV